MIIPKVNLRGILSSDNSSNDSSSNDKNKNSKEKLNNTTKKQNEKESTTDITSTSPTGKNIYDKEEALNQLWITLLATLFDDVTTNKNAVKLDTILTGLNAPILNEDEKVNHSNKKHSKAESISYTANAFAMAENIKSTSSQPINIPVSSGDSKNITNRTLSSSPLNEGSIKSLQKIDTNTELSGPNINDTIGSINGDQVETSTLSLDQKSSHILISTSSPSSNHHHSSSVSNGKQKHTSFLKKFNRQHDDSNSSQSSKAIPANSLPVHTPTTPMSTASLSQASISSNSSPTHEIYYTSNGQRKDPYSNFKRALWDCLFWTSGFEGVDTLLMRFIVARKGKVVEALKMLLNALSWRVHCDIAELCHLGERIVDSTEFSCGKVYFYNYDCEGRLVTYIHVSKHIKDVKPQAETEKMTILSMETIRLMLKKENPTACMVFDMNGFSMQNMDYGFIRFLLNCFQNYYPEMLGIALIVGAPWIFYGCWNIIKKLLDPVVANKVKFIKDISELKDYIPPENMPSCFGGTSNFTFDFIPYKEEEDVHYSNEEVEKVKKQWNHAKNEYIREIYQQYSSSIPNVKIETLLFDENLDKETIDGKEVNYQTSSTVKENNENNHDNNDKGKISNNDDNDEEKISKQFCPVIHRKTENELFEKFMEYDRRTRSRNYYYRSGAVKY